MFADEVDRWGYFVDDDRTAVPIHDHVAFRHRFSPQEENTRLFTIAEAVETVVKVIENN
jgi:hypothetical protein